MALVASGLAAALKAKRLATDIGFTDGPELEADCAAIAEAVVEYLTANAVIVPTLLVAPSGGGPVTGTGEIT